MEKCFLAAAVIYCAPQLFDLLTQLYGSHAASAELEGKVSGLCDRVVLRADPRSQTGLRIGRMDQAG